MCDSGHNTKLFVIYGSVNIYAGTYENNIQLRVCTSTHTTHVLLAKWLDLTFVPDLTIIIKPMHIESISETSLAMSPPKLHVEVPE